MGYHVEMMEGTAKPLGRWSRGGKIKKYWETRRNDGEIGLLGGTSRVLNKSKFKDKSKAVQGECDGGRAKRKEEKKCQLLRTTVIWQRLGTTCNRKMGGIGCAG
jgi:hypothetical protein